MPNVPPVPPAPPVPPTRLPTSVRREEIAGAVLRILGERGSAALTAAAVAGQVGLTSGALFRHFPTVEAMVDAAVDRAVATLEATFPASTLPPLERLGALAARRVEALRSDRGLAWLLRSDEAHVFLSPHAMARLLGLVARSRAFLEAALDEGRADGSIRADVPAPALLAIVTGTIHGLSGPSGVHRLHRPTAPRARDLVDTTLRALSRLLSPPFA